VVDAGKRLGNADGPYDEKDDGTYDGMVSLYAVDVGLGAAVPATPAATSTFEEP
jgi:hypothetical protein